ncbi:MAG: hypothetical protein LUF33_07055 [Clostridiales bacterium]|nr:hypothetical protein [Clostridiales bacterium]
MENVIKKYLPYAVIILAVYMIVPLIFIPEALENFSAVAYYFVFPATAIVCAAVYSAKYGLDFLFTLIAPVIYLLSMFVYNGGFTTTNVILTAAYLVSGIFGLFIGDIAFGDKRREQEKKEKAEAEEMLLQANRRDKIEKERRELRAESRSKNNNSEDYDFDYDKYTSDIDKPQVKSTEDEIDDILSEFGSSDKKR